MKGHCSRIRPSLMMRPSTAIGHLLAESKDLERIECGRERHVLGALPEEAGDQLHDGGESARLVTLERAVTIYEVHRSIKRCFYIAVKISILSL